MCIDLFFCVESCFSNLPHFKSPPRYPEMSPRNSVGISPRNSVGGGGGSGGESTMLDDAKRASRGRGSDRSKNSSSSSGDQRSKNSKKSKKSKNKKPKLSWKIRLSTAEVIEKNKHLSRNLTVTPIFSLFEVCNSKVPTKDKDDRGKVIYETKLKEAKRLVFPFKVLSESPHDIVCEIARDGYLEDLKSPNPDLPDFKLPLKETDFDRISGELTRMQMAHGK